MHDTVIDYMQSNRPINRLCHSKQDRKYNTAAHIYEKVCQDPTIITNVQDSKQSSRTKHIQSPFLPFFQSCHHQSTIDHLFKNGTCNHWIEKIHQKCSRTCKSRKIQLIRNFILGGRENKKGNEIPNKKKLEELKKNRKDRTL